MARRSILLLVAGLLATAGCFGTGPPPPPPPRPTQICGQSFAGAGNYQISFYNLGQTNTGFVTADGFAPIRLTDGRTAWWMSDTTTGTANPDNSVSGRGNVHNSVVWQEGSCLRPQFGNPEMVPNSGGTWRWPGSSVVSGDQMLVFSYIVRSTGPGAFDFAVDGTAVARYQLPNLQLLSVNTMPQTPGKGGGNIPWGIRAFVSGGTVYLYGTEKYTVGPFPVADAWVARAPFNDPTNLEYFTNATLPIDPEWSPDFGKAKPMSFTKFLPNDDSSPLAQLSVVQDGSRYIASAFAADVFQDNQGRSFVNAWTATSPQGPWQKVMDGTNPRNIAVFTKRSANQVAYDARTASLSGGAGWTVVYSANDPDGQFSDWTLYRGEFATPNGFPP
jgi:hypothetical protein